LIPVRILGTGSVLPGRVVTTRELVERAMPGADPEVIEAKTGIRTRYWAEPGTALADVAADALRQALAAANLAPTDLRRVLFACSTGGDSLMPSTASAVMKSLGLFGSCDGFDVNNSCVGFLSALDLGARCVATGAGPVGVVAAEMPSRHIHPKDARPYIVFGDGAAAAVLGPGRPDEGILASSFGTNARLGGTTQLLHPGLTGSPTYIEFLAPNQELVRLALTTLLRAASATAAASGLHVREIEWVLPHQPNGRMLEEIVAGLEIDPARTVAMVDEVGSIGAASIPMSLDRLLRTRQVAPGDRILMAGVGAGVSYGAVLYQVAP